MGMKANPFKKEPLKVIGVSRMDDNDQSILVSFNREPTNEEFVAFHICIRAVPDWEATAEDIIEMQGSEKVKR